MPYKDPEAAKAARKRYYEANKDRVRELQAAWREANRDKFYQKIREWHEANPERVAEIKKASAARNPRGPKPVEVQKRASRRWLEKHPERAQAYVSARRAARIQRTALWFGELDDLVVREAHHLARLRRTLTGVAWHVDHVVPLRGELVSGLHVWNNLSVIPGTVNRAKSNQFSPK